MSVLLDQTIKAFGVSRAQFGVTEVQGSLKRSDIKRKYMRKFMLQQFLGDTRHVLRWLSLSETGQTQYAKQLIQKWQQSA